MDNDLKPIPPIRPFQRFVIQNFPFIEKDFQDLDSYGLWCKVIEYVKLIAESQNECIDEVNQLADYVENYFKNLDVQEEINNKLDEMAEDGSLEAIIGSYISEVYVTPESFGAKGDGTTDDTQALQDAIDYAFTNKVSVHLTGNTYAITSPLHIYGNPDPTGKGTEIIGNGVGKSIIVKTTTTADTDYNNNSFDAAIIVDKQEASDGSIHNIRLTEFTLDGSETSAYGIAEKIGMAGSEFKKLEIRNFTNSGIYFVGNTYLDRITQVRVRGCNYGFYIFGGINTSLVIANCYSVVCTNGYKINAVYSQLDSPACDSATGIAYDLERFNGTVISAGSESVDADTVFNFQNSHCTLINPITFPNYEDSSAYHIKLGSGSRINIIGGRLMYDGLGRNVPAEGGFSLNGYQSSLNLDNVRIGDYKIKDETRPNDANSTKTLSTPHGSATTYGKALISYIGTDGRTTSGVVETGLVGEKLKSQALFLGAGFDKRINSYSELLTSQPTTLKGDIVLSSRPDEVRGIGWTQTEAATGNWKHNNLKKIPIVDSGATTSRPTYALEVGQMYYDTTLNKPVWCKTKGGYSYTLFTVSDGASADGTIAITTSDINLSIDVEVGDSVDDIKAKLLAINEPRLNIYEDGQHRIVMYAYFYGQCTAPSVDVGDTGVVITETHDRGSNPTWVDATGTTA